MVYSAWQTCFRGKILELGIKEADKVMVRGRES